MGIYAVASVSGSAGKSTSATALAVQTALRHKRRTLLIDFDAQGNATTWFGIKTNGPTIADVLLGRATIEEAAIPIPDVPGLFLVPASRDGLDTVQVHLSRRVGSEMEFYEKLSSYDDAYHVIIDCGGSINVLVIAAMLATQAWEDTPRRLNPEDESSPMDRSGIITCTQPMPKENEGIPELVRQLETINKTYRLKIELLGVVPCIVPPQNAGDVYIEQLDDLYDVYLDRVTPPVRRSAVVPEAYSHGIPLPLYPKARIVAGDYEKVLTHLNTANCLG
ncbi:ParA family protein [Actinokineospora enzanensis]|uniref:ParA family protein n=1 Tax=Actinokineospora enzanensis TaxID=155975 RepID=UPI0003745CAF|nr:ParA family protein [Actinokineospora enzanensis]